MADIATLRMGIDARPAKQGAAEFNAATRSMQTNAEASLTRIERAARLATKAFLGFGALKGTLYTLDKFRVAASDAEETLSKFNVVFREQARGMEFWAQSFGDAVGRSTYEIEGWLAGLQDTFVPLGIARDQAAELSKSLVTLAVDVASFNNKLDAEVVRDFTSALIGNHETVRKFGIIISESALKQEALAQGFRTSYEQLTDLEKVQLRYSLIQKSTTDAQGDAIRTMDSHANQVKRLKASYEELQVLLGEQFLPETTRALQMLNQYLQEYDSGIRRYISDFREGLDIAQQIQSTMRQVSMPWWWQAYQTGQGLRGGQEPPSGPPMQGRISPMPATAMPGGTPTLKMTRLNPEDIARMSAEEDELMVERTREAIDSIRHMDYLTRMERIENLRIYQQENALTLAEVGDANKILNDEISNLERSRVDAMKMYHAELREDFEDLSLYQSEKAAQVAQSIEGSMSNAFHGMISQGMSWRDAMSQFFLDVGASFSRMASDMLARAVMLQVMNAMMPGAGSALQLGGAGSSVNIAGSSFVNPGAVFGAPSALGNAFDRGRVVKFGLGDILMGGLPALLFGGPIQMGLPPAFGFAEKFFRKNERLQQGPFFDLLYPYGINPSGSAFGNVFRNGRLVPMASGRIFGGGGVFPGPTYFPMAGGKIGLAGEAGPEAAVPLKRLRTGRLGIEMEGRAPNITLAPAPVKIVLVKDQKAAQLEVMRSPEGQAVIISALRENGLV